MLTRDDYKAKIISTISDENVRYSLLNQIINDSEKAKIIADKYWPGPITMIFEKTDIVPYETTGGLETVAVRMPSEEIALELIADLQQHIHTDIFTGNHIRQSG